MSVFSIIQAAGWPIWPLIIASIISMALVVERFISLKAARVAPKSLLDEALAASATRVPACAARMASSSHARACARRSQPA